MTTKAVKALFWKEYRQHVALWTAMIVMCVLFQIMMYVWFHWIMGQLNEIVSLDYMTMCSCAFVVFYAIACSAILFAKEKEEKTDNFLRNMPITGNTVLVGKLLWLFGSMAVLMIALTVVTFAWGLILPPAQWSAQRFWFGVGWFFVYCFSGICLGLFWSSITRKQLHAIVGTLASMIIIALLVASIILQFASAERPFFDELTLVLYLLACAVLGAIGIRNGGRWLRKREDKTIGAKIDALQNKQWRHKDVRIEQLRSQKQPRGEFRWLLWQCYRQSPLLFKMGLGLSVLLLCWPILMTAFTEGSTPYHFVKYFIPVAFGIAGFIICCNIFYPDHNKNGIMVLSHRGISPGKVWWSRIVMFGTLLVVCLAALIGSQLINEWLGMPIRHFDADEAISYTLFFLCTFIIGQFASVISRSLVLPLVYTAVFLFLGFWWRIYVLYFNDLENASSILGGWRIGLVFLPIALSFFVASRLRMSDWMRDRPLRASWRKLALTFGGGLVLSTALLATVRLTTGIPTASLGYQLDPWVLKQNIDYHANYARFTELRQSLEGNNRFADYLAAREEFRAMDENPLKSPGQNFFLDAFVYTQIMQQIASPDVTSEFLRDAIAFLETSHENRVPAATAVKRHYEWLHYTITTDEIWREDFDTAYVRTLRFGRFISPWEQTRALRFWEYRFQTDSLVAEQSERLIFDNEGDAEYIAEKIASLMTAEPNRMLYGIGFEYLPVTPYTIYYHEQARRVAMLQAALRLWHDEHGELPETLDQLAGVYLTEVPLVPFYNKPFEYVPHPDENDARDTPYLMTQLDDALPVDYVLADDHKMFIYEIILDETTK